MPLRIYPGSNRSPNYRIRGSHLQVRIDKSAGTADLATARKVLKQTEAEIEYNAFKPPGEVATPFAKALRLYVNETGNQRFLSKLLEYFGEKDIYTITQQDIMQCSHDLYPMHTNATRNRQVYTPMMAILRMNGIYKPFKRPAQANGNKRTFFFTQEAAARLVNAAYDRDEEFGLLLVFLFYTGARLNEALTLTIDNLNLSEAWAVFPKTKNGRPRTVYLPPALVSAMAAHPRGYDRKGWVFKFVKGGRIYKLLNDAETASGVIIPEGVSFHATRHTYGAWMRRYGGLDTSGLVATGAWASRDAAQIYEHTDATESARQADKLPQIVTQFSTGRF